jgi:hypothetical protein
MMMNPANAANRADRQVAGETCAQKPGTHIPAKGLST